MYYSTSPAHQSSIIVRIRRIIDAEILNLPSTSGPSNNSSPRSSQTRTRRARAFLGFLFDRYERERERESKMTKEAQPQVSYTVEKLVEVNPYNPDILSDLENYVNEQVSFSFLASNPQLCL
jgi:hypothetical protein